MAYDKVVDSTQLNADLTSVANAIRTKGGTSESLAFPTDFVSAIGNIPSGGASGDWREITQFTGYHILRVRYANGGPLFPETIKVSFSSAKTAGGNYNNINNYSPVMIEGEWGDRGLRRLEVYDIPSDVTSINTLVQHTYNVDTVYFDGTVNVYQMNAAFAYTNVKHILGTLDISYAQNEWSISAFTNTDIRDITFVPNCIKYNLSFSSCANIEDASLVSIANGLDGTVTGQKLTLHNTAKTKCTALMGTNNNGTFEIDAQGAMSLTSFITTVKGWTIA